MSKQAKLVKTTLSFEEMLKKVADTKYEAPKKETKKSPSPPQVIGFMEQPKKNK